MKKIRIGINGMGRIGRILCRLALDDYREQLELVAVNDLVAADVLVNALRRDSTYGRFPAPVVGVSECEIRLGSLPVKVFSHADPKQIPWGDSAVDLVFECTGRFLTRELAAAHLQGGARKVVISAPPKDETPVYVVGVNDHELAGADSVISNASCTTNALAPVVKALDDAFGVISGLASTTHAVTSGQSVVDGFGTERARAALNNIIPTTTGAARAVARTLPHLSGKLNSSGLRVPVTTGSVVEAVLVIRGERTADEVVAALRDQAVRLNQSTPTGRVLYVGDDFQVSADAVGSPWSSMVLAPSVMAVPCGKDTQVKVTSFYDNEMGYANRLADLGIALTASSE